MRLPNATEGTELPAAVQGFPIFYGTRRFDRIITGDIWAYLRYAVQKKNIVAAADQEKALSYLTQAFDFFEAASNLRQASRPLLYYYAFLNLAKVLLLHKGLALPNQLRHGIADLHTNATTKIGTSNQEIAINNVAGDHSELFPEIIEQFRAAATPALAPALNLKVIDLLAEVPAIHRTYVMARDAKPIFCPVTSFTIKKANWQLWALVKLDRTDADVKKTIGDVASGAAFAGLMTQVSVADEDAKKWMFFETSKQAYTTRSLDVAIGRLATQLRDLGVWTILTKSGYRYYLCTRQQTLPQFCSAYAVMFYLGSVTRYKPFLYEDMISDYSWPVNEFLDTQPQQMLHLLASYLAKTEVVSPFALH